MNIKHVLPYVLVSFVSIFIFNIVKPTLKQNVSRPSMMDYGASSPDMGADTFRLKLGQSESSIMPASQPRMTTLDTHVVLIVKNIETALVGIEDYVGKVGGFVVSKSQDTQTEGGYGYLSARVPRDKVDQTVAYLKDNSSKVISVNESGNDITEQFKDTQARLATLYETKTAIEQIMASATASKDLKSLLEAQREIMSIQSQIDQEKGQETYLKEVANTTLISAEFRTDEYALPYNPDTGWAPDKVFKNAVRSLVVFARNMGTLAIWGLVYSPIFVGIGLVVIVVNKKFKQYAKK